MFLKTKKFRWMEVLAEVFFSVLSCVMNIGACFYMLNRCEPCKLKASISAQNYAPDLVL